MSFRLAAYAVCIDSASVLLARCPSREAGSVWTLPGGGVEHGEDPIDAVVREVAEETGCHGVVKRLLGVDSRLIPAGEAIRGVPHQNVGIFYEVQLELGELRPRPGDDTIEVAWRNIADLPLLERSSLVEVGVRLAQMLPPTGHVDPVVVGGLLHH